MLLLDEVLTDPPLKGISSSSELLLVLCNYQVTVV